MAIRIPQNQIQYKYTAGKEYMYKDTYREYQGPYYELNNQLFAGNEFNSNAPILIPTPVVGSNTANGLNSLLTKASTYVYGKISNVQIPNTEITSYYFNVDTTDNVFRYFTKKINENIIKEINEDNFNLIKSNSLYISIRLYYQSNFNENELNEAEKIMSGIKEYINTTYAPGVTD